jgi:Fe2+ or Zn2+ uptake regulation protein
MWPKDRLDFTLSSARVTRTEARRKIYAAIKKRERCRTTDLIRDLKGEVHQATIYRVIKIFLSLGIIQQNGHDIEVVPPHTYHFHRFMCVKCHREIRFNDVRLEKAVKRIAQERTLELTGHQVELSGRCPHCSK